MTYLLIFEACWADEFDCQEFMMFNSRKEAEEYRDSLLRESEEGGDLYFGTNQWFEADELNTSNFRIEEISDDFAQRLFPIFGRRFGLGIL